MDVAVQVGARVNILRHKALEQESKMFTRRTASVWIGILALSGIFLTGQESWFPDSCTGVDCGEHGTCEQGVCECDAGYQGEFCDELVEIEPCEPPSCAPYTPIPAGQLAPTGCETYIGAHPLYPGELLCCSAPRAGSPPVCAPGDTPDIPCVMEYEFCDDGTAAKAYSPDPKTGYPGQTVSTSGSWSVDSGTGELEIVTTASAMAGAMIMVTTETYPSAFTYDNGTKLDLNSSAVVTINEGGIGYYHRDASMVTDITGLWAATLDAHLNTDLTVTAAGYDSTFAQDIVCTPPLGMVCLVTPKSEEKHETGTHSMPIELFITPTGARLYQTDTVKTLVFERQSNLCDGIECGDHGFCEDGVCVCKDGYTGEFCDVPGPCVGIDCGEHGTCVEGICACAMGYAGDRCEVDIDECNPNPCLHGGSCAEGAPGTYNCTCVDGYTGHDCQNCPTDADGDGYGNPASILCTHPESDCDDDHATVHPAAPELCDGLDNQCPGDPGFGFIDEGYAACADMVSIPSGCFNMGDAFAEGWPDELPVHHICLSAFEMDIHEITNAEYAECVAHGGCTPPLQMTSYSRASYFGNPTYDDYPVIWMEWYQVQEYCTWAGKRLPTEAEWEYAARGGLPGKRYPWGNAISTADANFNLNVGDTSMAEAYPPNGYGLYDMAGNVWEWVADWYSEDYYSVSPTNNPTGPASGARRVNRGGSWDHSTFGLRAANRCDFCHADRHGNNLGGRCARSGVCTDEDHDGYGNPASADCIYPGWDCDDHDPDVHPAAVEVCDGKDNNCENGVDEEPVSSASCSNGVYCDGVEQCGPGSCRAGADPCPDDGVFCNGNESCDEADDQCVSSGDPCPDQNDCSQDQCDETGRDCTHTCNAQGFTDPCCADQACSGAEVCSAAAAVAAADSGGGCGCSILGKADSQSRAQVAVWLALYCLPVGWIRLRRQKAGGAAPGESAVPQRIGIACFL